MNSRAPFPPALGRNITLSDETTKKLAKQVEKLEKQNNNGKLHLNVTLYTISDMNRKDLSDLVHKIKSLSNTVNRNKVSANKDKRKKAYNNLKKRSEDYLKNESRLTKNTRNTSRFIHNLLREPGKYNDTISENFLIKGLQEQQRRKKKGVYLLEILYNGSYCYALLQHKEYKEELYLDTLWTIGKGTFLVCFLFLLIISKILECKKITWISTPISITAYLGILKSHFRSGYHFLKVENIYHRLFNKNGDSYVGDTIIKKVFQPIFEYLESSIYMNNSPAPEQSQYMNNSPSLEQSQYMTNMFNLINVIENKNREIKNIKNYKKKLIGLKKKHGSNIIVRVKDPNTGDSENVVLGNVIRNTKKNKKITKKKREQLLNIYNNEMNKLVNQTNKMNRARKNAIRRRNKVKNLQREGYNEIDNKNYRTGQYKRYKTNNRINFYTNIKKTLNKKISEKEKKLQNLYYYENHLTMGGKKYIHIPNVGKRLIRHYKNGKSYVIINKKKVKI